MIYNYNNAKVISNNVRDTYGMLCYLMKLYSLNLSKMELETISNYLAFYNYYVYKMPDFYGNKTEIFKYKQSIICTNGEVGDLIYDYKSNEISFAEFNSITNFTEGERIDFIFTENGKIVFYTFDEFNKVFIYNEQKSKKIKINEYREVFIPSNLEPDDFIDLSDNISYFDKIVCLKMKIEMIKTKSIFNNRSDKNVKL